MNKEVSESKMKKMVVGITGASGSLYAKRLIEVLLEKKVKVHVIATDMGEQVFSYEIGCPLKQFIAAQQAVYGDLVVLEDPHNLFAGVASGSHAYEGVVILPCSMGTLAEIAHGFSKNLLTRSADVSLKEGRKLIIVPRETPFSTIHLENMLRLSQAGATILPAMPGFYHGPKELMDLVDFVVGKILDQLYIEHQLFKKWNEGNEKEINISI